MIYGNKMIEHTDAGRYPRRHSLSLENDVAHCTEFCPELLVCQRFDELQGDTVSAANKLTVTVPTVSTHSIT
jgi:hypothetical protein